MKVSELIAALQHMSPDDEVVIKVKRSSPSVGPLAAVGIDIVANGFDWNNGRVFLETDETVYAGLDRLEACAGFTHTVRNAIYFRNDSKHPESRDALAVQAIERGLAKWFPKQPIKELSDPAEPPK